MTAATANRPRLLDAEHPVMLAALDLHRAERVPLPIEPGSKRPASPSWQRVAYADEAAVIRAFGCMVEGAGVGARLGDGLADVDLDTPTARRAAPLLLPGTGAKSGRPGSPASHWWYLVDADHYVKHDGPDGAAVVELRASQGHQTVVPPSVHPSGEVLRWEGSGCLADAAEVDTDELRAGVAAVAVASILADVWPGQGSRHDAFLALSGGLLRDAHDHPGMVAWVHRIVRAVAILTRDDEAEQRAAEAVPSTVAKLAAGDAVTGWTTLAGLLAADDSEAVVKAAQRAADHLRDALGVPRVGVSVVDDTCPATAASSWAAVDLSATVAGLVNGTLEPPRPTVGELALSVDHDVRALFYSGRVNGVAGESGSGKTWTALVAAAQTLAAGAAVVFIDLEDHAAGVVGRLLAMGADPEAVVDLFTYVHPDERLSAAAAADLVGLLDEVAPALVVIDSTGEGLALEGANPNADDDVARWFRLLPRRVARHTCAPCVVVLDHVVKSDDGGLWPIGSQRKRAAVDGAQYMQRLVKPFDRENPGAAVLVCAKDRHGHYHAGQRVAELVVTPAGSGAVGVDLVALAGAGGTAKPFRPTALMERVSRYLETHPGAADRTGRQIRENVRGKVETIRDALDVLVTEGHVSAESGPRNATVYTVAKPFRAGEPLDD